MSEQSNFSQRWQAYRPSKAAWLWSCVACIALTMIVGFTAGGWVTGGTARTMAAQASLDAREQLVASICVERFVAAPNAATNLVELKEASSWERDDFIQDGGWTNVQGLEKQVAGAADVCADQLVAMEDIPARAVDPAASAAGSSSADG